jgi:hypothetical protein
MRETKAAASFPLSEQIRIPVVSSSPKEETKIAASFPVSFPLVSDFRRYMRETGNEPDSKGDCLPNQ